MSVRRASAVAHDGIQAAAKGARIAPAGNQQRGMLALGGNEQRGTLKLTVAIRSEGSRVLTHTKGEKSAADRAGVRGVAGWMSRSVEAVRADLQFVDCGSLDVLLYCRDDVAAGNTREPEVEPGPNGVAIGVMRSLHDAF